MRKIDALIPISRVIATASIGPSMIDSTGANTSEDSKPVTPRSNPATPATKSATKNCAQLPNSTNDYPAAIEPRARSPIDAAIEAISGHP